MSHNICSSSIRLHTTSLTYLILKISIFIFKLLRAVQQGSAELRLRSQKRNKVEPSLLSTEPNKCGVSRGPSIQAPTNEEHSLKMNISAKNARTQFNLLLSTSDSIFSRSTTVAQNTPTEREARVGTIRKTTNCHHQLALALTHHGVRKAKKLQEGKISEKRIIQVERSLKILFSN